MILVAGIGYVGEALADALHAAGQSVAGITRSAESAAALADAKPYPVFACDISDRDALTDLPIPMPLAVVHCASSGRGGVDAYRAVYLEGSRNLIEVFQPGRFVFTSSTSVYAQTGGETVTEESPAEPGRETGRILRATEDLVLAREGGVVARLAGIYGLGRSVILKKFLGGEAVIEDDGSRFLNQVHRDDIVSALTTLLCLRPDAAGGGCIYNVADDHPLTQKECYTWLAQAFGKPMPPAGPRDLNRKRGWTNKRVSNARLRALGWAPRYPSFLDAIEKDPDLVTSIEAEQS